MALPYKSIPDYKINSDCFNNIKYYYFVYDFLKIYIKNSFNSMYVNNAEAFPVLL